MIRTFRNNRLQCQNDKAIFKTLKTFHRINLALRRLFDQQSHDPKKMLTEETKTSQKEILDSEASVYHFERLIINKKEDVFLEEVAKELEQISQKSWRDLDNHQKIVKSLNVFCALETVSRKIEPYENNDSQNQKSNYRKIRPALQQIQQLKELLKTSTLFASKKKVIHKLEEHIQYKFFYDRPKTDQSEIFCSPFRPKTANFITNQYQTKISKKQQERQKELQALSLEYENEKQILNPPISSGENQLSECLKTFSAILNEKSKMEETANSPKENNHKLQRAYSNEKPVKIDNFLKRIQKLSSIENNEQQNFLNRSQSFSSSKMNKSLVPKQSNFNQNQNKKRPNSPQVLNASNTNIKTKSNANSKPRTQNSLQVDSSITAIQLTQSNKAKFNSTLEEKLKESRKNKQSEQIWVKGYDDFKSTKVGLTQRKSNRKTPNYKNSIILRQKQENVRKGVLQKATKRRNASSFLPKKWNQKTKTEQQNLNKSIGIAYDVDVLKRLKENQCSQELNEQDSSKQLNRNESRKTGILIRNSEEQRNEQQMRQNLRVNSQMGLDNRKNEPKNLLTELSQISRDFHNINQQYNSGGVSILFTQQEYLKYLEDRKMMRMIKNRKKDDFPYAFELDYAETSNKVSNIKKFQRLLVFSQDGDWIKNHQSSKIIGTAPFLTQGTIQ